MLHCHPGPLLGPTGLLLIAVGCATSSPAPVAAVEATGPAEEASAASPAEELVTGPPATWKDALERYSSTCPVPFFTLKTPEPISAGGRAFTLSGSALALQGGKWEGPLKLGVLGAVKDADDDTRQNLKKAAAAFHKAGVHFVVANGDLTGNEAGALVPVVEMLGEEFSAERMPGGVAVPVFAHSGNYEWTSAFTQAFAERAVTWPHLFNMNVIRDVDFGGVHLVSLPGYFNRRFLQSGACHYSDVDVADLTRHAQGLAARGETVILTSHGPPLGTTATALDVTSDGPNVGDPQLNGLLTDGKIAFGIFSHILEAGGRAVDDVAGTSAVRLPMKAPRQHLYVNAGASSSFGWGMVSGKTSRGMAAIVTIDPTASTGHVEFIELR